MTARCGALLTVMLAGCSAAPECVFEGEPLTAKSAGCLVYQEQALLLVSSHQDLWGPPGGSVDAEESAQCAAVRETWEETGVVVTAGRLARVFDNGFHLFWCTPSMTSEPRVLRPFEVKTNGYIPTSRFAELTWRFPDQAAELITLMDQQQEIQANDR